MSYITYIQLQVKLHVDSIMHCVVHFHYAISIVHFHLAICTMLFHYAIYIVWFQYAFSLCGFDFDISHFAISTL
jgi:hypothetical protein